MCQYYTIVVTSLKRSFLECTDPLNFDTLRKLYLHFLSHWMGYDRDDSFPYDFEPNRISFGSESRKENCHHDHIPFNMKENGNIVLSV